MKKIVIGVMAWLAMAAVCAFGAEISDITLDDGSVLRAEVVSLQGGKYTLRSSSLGEIKLDASRVSQISRHKDGQSPASAAPGLSESAPLGSPEEIKARVEAGEIQALNDPAAMQEAELMASSPEFKKLLEDPEAVAALKSGDTATLQKKPAFQAIMKDPRLQGAAEKLMNRSNDK